MPQPVVPDFVEPLGQDVLAEAAQELGPRQGARAPAPRAGLAVLAAEGDGVRIHRGDPAVGAGGAEHVAGEVVEDGLFAGAPHGDVGDPGHLPDPARQVEAGQPPGQRGADLAAHELAQRPDGNQEAVAGDREPVLAIGSQCSPSGATPPPVTRQWTCG
jgi:hypothetical protein